MAYTPKVFAGHDKKRLRIDLCNSGQHDILSYVDVDYARIGSHAHLVRPIFYRPVARKYFANFHFYASAGLSG